MRKTTLPTCSKARKEIPLFSGVFKYAPAAWMGMAQVSKTGNDKHNPGEPLHHSRGKSNDHGDCILRHLMDIADLVADFERRPDVPFPSERVALLSEANQMLWRAALFSQELHERFGEAPLAPAAKLPSESKPAATDVVMSGPEKPWKLATGMAAYGLENAHAATGTGACKPAHDHEGSLIRVQCPQGSGGLRQYKCILDAGHAGSHLF